MTIEGFWKEFNEKIPLEQYRVSFPDYIYSHYNKRRKFLTVGIDIFQWIFEHASFAESKSFTGFPESEKSVAVVIAGIASKLRYLISLPLNFVIVFDGKIKFEKHRWDIEKKASSEIVFEERYNEDLDRIRNQEHIMNGRCITSLLELLEAWNISYLHAPGDAEIELARLNKAGIIDAIISNDADGFAYGATVILRNFSRFSNDKPSTATKGGIKKGTDYFVTPVDSELIKQLDLDTDNIIFIACCQGDDYSKGVKGLGIKKAWALATNKSEDFDAVQGLKDIYVSKIKSDYLTGKMPYPYTKRLELLGEYKAKLMEHIANNGKTYFGRVHSSDVILPDDYVISSHFYPHFAKYLFEFESFETNFSEYSGALNNNCCFPLLPQPLSIAKSAGDSYQVYRGNSLKGFMYLTVFEGQICFPSGRVRYTPFHWFRSPDYEKLLKLTKIGRSQREGMEFLAKSLGRCYLWRAIVNTRELDLKARDIYIKSQKSVQIKCESREFEQAFYQVKFKPREIFKSLLGLEEHMVDVNLNDVEEEYIHTWLTSYLFFIDDNGRKLVEIYNNEKSSKANTPKTTPKRTPKKNRTPTQKTTLDLLSGSTKSPIKILTRKPSLLEISEASKSVTIKRSVLDVDTSDIFSSPKKKIKPITVDDKMPVPNPIMLEPFEEDAEISRVLENSDYVGGNSLTSNNGNDNNTNHDIFFDFHENLNSLMTVSHRPEMHLSETKDIIIYSGGKDVDASPPDALNQATGLIPARGKLKRDKLTIARGMSNLDEMTRLPELPQGPGNLDSQEDKEEDKMENYHSEKLNDTFSSTDSIQKLFAEEKKDEGGASNKVMAAKGGAENITLDDTFSSNESIERIFGLQRNTTPETHDNLEEVALTVSVDLTHNYRPEDGSDMETLDEATSTPVQKPQAPTLAGSHNLLQCTFPLNQQQENSYSLPSGFDGDEILLADSTDDESMWVVPEKD
ncbi:hypothetical protein PMKS-002594 [Pichia membranifaciens]|uniref:XPG-I domain-containing protein n=1 Tax=Pichia membranifaciens TaxID=4926 RepID=A0A1Q2YHU7_9ASCO|nr:hypothetical protein PMKS-002594 [Pichia membranifaciens]